MPIEEKIDFRDDKKSEEAKKWSKVEREKWEKSATVEEKKTIEKLINDQEKLKINEYVNKIKFTTDVVFEREEAEAKDYLAQGVVKPLIDVERLRESIERNKLETTLVGYAKINPLELGINFELRDGSLKISNEAANKVNERINNKNFKKFDFLEVSLNGNNIDKNTPILLETRVNRGEGYGMLIDSKSNIGSLILKDGISLQPKDLSIMNIWGKEYIVAKVDLVKVNDFENAKSTTWGKDNYGDLQSKLPTNQVEALSLYVKQEYKNINSYLRTGNLPEGQDKNTIESRINAISSALSFKPIPENITLYRRVGQEAFGYGSTSDSPIITFDKPKPYSKEEQISVKEFRDKWLGKEFNEKAFMSTSLSSADITAFQSGRFIFRITTPEGIRGAYVSGFDGFVGENEVLLDKNTTLRIDRITEVKELMANRTEITKVIIDATAIQK